MKTTLSSIIFSSFLLFLIGCSKDAEMTKGQEGLDSEMFEDEDATPNQPEVADISDRLAAKALYYKLYKSSNYSITDPQWIGDEENCNPGSIHNDVKDKIMARLTYYRKAVGLENDLVIDVEKSIKAQYAALMMQANKKLDHSPASSWKCYSSQGKEAASNSLLTTAANASAIDSYIKDAGEANGPVGHRRWLLWPSLNEIGLGNTSKSNAIWVLGNKATAIANAPAFIAWPPQGYVPMRLVYPRWSFSIKDADFSNAKVSMENVDGIAVPLKLEALELQYGDPTVVWIPEGVETSVTVDTSYKVNIKGVLVNGVIQEFDYTVILFDPNV